MKFFTEFLSWIIDCLFPKSELVQKIEMMTAKELLEDGQRLFLETVPVMTTGRKEQPLIIFQYRDPLIRQAIWEMKYRGNQKIIHLFAEGMADFIIEEIAEEWLFNQKEPILLIPIPLSNKRKLLRGFNQMELFCSALLTYLPKNTFIIETNALKKVRHTISQTKTRNRKERLRNLTNAFEVAHKESVKGKIIVLIDDVFTTGSTMKNASTALRKASAKRIFPVAIAH